MSAPLADKTVDQLVNIVANHRAAGKTQTDMFAAALRALDARRHKGFDLQTSLDFLIGAARARRFVSYKDVATANGIEWAKARRAISAHLDAVCEYAASRKMPLLTAIVVNAEGVADGSMSVEARTGYMLTATRLGRGGADPQAAVAAEQQRVFDHFSGAAAA